MVSKKEWGKAVWFLLHTLTYKLNNDGHTKLLMNQFFNICNNLPCSDCSNHANNIIKTMLLFKSDQQVLNILLF